jgi:aminoglycoside/choline kinase family phosphotransferase
VLAHVPVELAGLPAVIHKDANIRNFILTEAGVAIVDFDDLTLAPYAYDLTKLIVSTATTFGRATRSLCAFRNAISQREASRAGGPRPGAVPPPGPPPAAQSRVETWVRPSVT